MEKNQKQNSGMELDIILLLKSILYRSWLIILVGILGAAIAFTITKLFVQPTYRCSFTAYINNTNVQTSKEYLSGSDMSASKELVRTYAQILTSNTILRNAADSISLDASNRELRGMVSPQIQDETEIIAVYVTCTDPDIAYRFADSIAKTAPAYMADIVEGSSMKIVDYPQMNPGRHGPSYIKNALIGFILGALLIIIREIILYFTDDTVKDESEVEQRFSISNLGVIPDIGWVDSENAKSNYGYGYGSSGYGKPHASAKAERRHSDAKK